MIGFMPERQPPRHHLHLEQTPLERARLWVEIAAFIAAGAWAIYTFVFQTRIAPLFLPPHENISMNTQRVAETPANYLERVEVTIRNDGDVDIDTAALVITVFGATAGKDLALDSSATKHTMAYRQMPDSAWTPVGAYGMLLNGAVGGAPRHLIMRPGDTVPLQQLIVVPRKYRVLEVKIQTIYDRYPISQRVPARLYNENGAVILKSKGFGVDLEAYSGV
ncbi:MAG: hypothetical protein WAL67_06745 [Candidatus Cybelea sp.]